MKHAKIFLVDDDLFSLNVYRQGLENLGFSDMTLYLNGTICLNNLHQKPNIIFLDHHMDDILGFDVLKKLNCMILKFMSLLFRLKRMLKLPSTL